MLTMLTQEVDMQYILVSAPPAAYAEKVMNYAIDWARHPDSGSEFESKVTPLLTLPDESLFAILIKNGYDGLLLFDKSGSIVGHVFYQKHNTWWGVLHVFVREDVRRQGYATLMVRERVIAGWQANLESMMISKGGDPRVVKIHRKLVAPENPLSLQFRVQAGSQPGSLLFVRSE